MLEHYGQIAKQVIFALCLVTFLYAPLLFWVRYDILKTPTKDETKDTITLVIDKIDREKLAKGESIWFGNYSILIVPENYERK